MNEDSNNHSEAGSHSTNSNFGGGNNYGEEILSEAQLMLTIQTLERRKEMLEKKAQPTASSTMTTIQKKNKKVC